MNSLREKIRVADWNSFDFGADLGYAWGLCVGYWIGTRTEPLHPATAWRLVTALALLYTLLAVVRHVRMNARGL